MAQKVGLVLEGGAMRGLFTVGVLDVLMEENIRFDGAIGVSAGAAFGCNFKSHQKGRPLRYNLRYCNHWRYCSFRSLLFTGDLYGADFCYRRLPEELDPFDWETYRADPMPFYALCTQVETGEPKAFLCQGEKERVLDIFRASASMPLVSRMVKIDGEPYLDGGIASSIPLALFRNMGYEKNVVILTQPRSYVKKQSAAASWIRLCYGKYPALCRAMEERHLVYQREREEVFSAEKEGAALVIAPPEPLPVTRMEKDAEKLRAAYEIGVLEGKKHLPLLRSFLAETEK